MADTKNIAIEIIGIPILIIGILTIFTDWPFTKILAISFACGFIAVIVSLLTSQQPQSQQPEQTPNQRSATPITATPPRKIPIGIIATILVITIAGGIFFSIPGDTSNKIERVKSIIPKEKEIPDIPVECVVHITDFRGEDRIGTGKHIYADTNSEGHLIVRTTDDDWSATIYLALDEKLQRRKAVEIQTIIKVINGPSKSSGFGAYIKDSDSRKFVFDGQKINFPSDGEKFDFPDNRAENGEYKISLARIVSNDNKTVKLRAEVDPSRKDTNKETVIYDLFSEKNLIEIGINFYSKDRESKLEISEIKVYASEN